MKGPTPFLDVHVQHIDTQVGLAGLCAGYEQSRWRAEELARHLMEWLPEFALTYSEMETLDSSNAVELLRKAAAVVYSSERYQRRGEFGEILLHVIVRQLFNSVPAISKIYYKDSANDTVKGFDAVHVVEPSDGDGLELWLGEAKFYSDIDAAIRDVCEELRLHTSRDFLRSEFLLISNKIDSAWKWADDFRTLIHQNTSLDKVFARCRIPVLLTYDSDVVSRHDCCDEEFGEAFRAEVTKYYKRFCNNARGLPMRIELFLLPLKSKDELVAILHKELKKWQQV